jgi:hypothetical protein
MGHHGRLDSLTLSILKAAEMEHRYSLPSQITIRVKDWTDVDIY